MRVVIVSGLWPPDVGGPAIHAPALADFLEGRGHQVQVVTTAATAPLQRGYRVRWVSRGLPGGIRHLAVAAEIARAALRSDVVYATSMVRRAAAGATLARRPFVVKLVSDEAYERARRSGAFDGTLEQFQVAGGLRAALLRRTRTAALGRAAHIFCPSTYLRDIAASWGLATAHLSVLPNAAPAVNGLPERDAARGELGFHRPTFAFAGRLTAQKSLDDLLVALAAVPGADLAILGDGPERGRLERSATELGLDGRVRFLGSAPRDGVLRLFRAADAAVLSSSWENFPHTVVEALAVGTPVVATSVGGVPEIVVDGVNGLLVRPGAPAELATALRRLVEEPTLRAGLAGCAAASVAPLSEEILLGRVEAELERAAGR
jgi:glycosyltransferase involved in cell wall biosynthesis